MPQKRRRFATVQDSGGALLANVGATSGLYEVDAETARKAVRFIRKHAEDAELLIDILGLKEHDESS